MKKVILLLCLLLTSIGFSQIKVYTSYIDNYWEANNSITQTNDFTKRLDLINRLYIDKGSKGLNRQ